MDPTQGKCFFRHFTSFQSFLEKNYLVISVLKKGATTQNDAGLLQFETEAHQQLAQAESLTSTSLNKLLKKDQLEKICISILIST